MNRGPADTDGDVSIPMDNRALLGNDTAGTRYDKLTTPLSSDGGGNHPRTISASIPPPPASAAGSSNHQQPPEQGEQEQDGDTSSDLMHGINSFWAIVFPVCMTMVFASIVVVNYRNSSIEASMQTYLVYGDSGSNSSDGASTVGKSLINALVIIGAIAILTFGMALLYKYNCMKFLGGYIMFASTAILSFVGGQLVDSVINDQLEWIVDWPSFIFVMLNFGVVGVVSIFYQKGTSKFVQNGYLVMVSVILAWEFSMWPEWTTFTFCFMFAVYDLCAVLTPCGPLKCLINLIQEKQAPLPGLLYEADVRDGVSNQPRQANTPSPPRAKPERTSSSNTSESSHASNHNVHNTHTNATRPAPVPAVASTTNSVPAAQPAADRPRNVAESDFTTYDCETLEELVVLLENFYRTFSPEDVWKAPQVAEKFMTTQERLWLLIFHKYQVCSCSMDMPCPVKARQDARRRAAAAEEEDDKTIKLGLGDFIFYSVLVGRAGIYDFSTFVVTFVCIVMGLGGTLFLLSVLHKALPALPISIFLATAFYFWTRYVFVDFCDFLTTLPADIALIYEYLFKRFHFSKPRVRVTKERKVREGEVKGSGDVRMNRLLQKFVSDPTANKATGQASYGNGSSSTSWASDHVQESNYYNNEPNFHNQQQQPYYQEQQQPYYQQQTNSNYYGYQQPKQHQQTPPNENSGSGHHLEEIPLSSRSTGAVYDTVDLFEDPKKPSPPRSQTYGQQQQQESANAFFQHQPPSSTYSASSTDSFFQTQHHQEQQQQHLHQANHLDPFVHPAPNKFSNGFDHQQYHRSHSENQLPIKHAEDFFSTSDTQEQHDAASLFATSSDNLPHPTDKFAANPFPSTSSNDPFTAGSSEYQDSSSSSSTDPFAQLTSTAADRFARPSSADPFARPSSADYQQLSSDSSADPFGRHPSASDLFANSSSADPFAGASDYQLPHSDATAGPFASSSSVDPFTTGLANYDNSNSPPAVGSFFAGSHEYQQSSEPLTVDAFASSPFDDQASVDPSSSDSFASDAVSTSTADLFASPSPHTLHVESTSNQPYLSAPESSTNQVADFTLSADSLFNNDTSAEQEHIPSQTPATIEKQLDQLSLGSPAKPNAEQETESSPFVAKVEETSVLDPTFNPSGKLSKEKITASINTETEDDKPFVVPGRNTTLEDSIRLAEMYKQMAERLEVEKNDLLKVLTDQADQFYQMQDYISSLEQELESYRSHDAQFK